MDDSLHSNLCITNAHKLIHLSELHQKDLKVNMKSQLTALTLPYGSLYPPLDKKKEKTNCEISQFKKCL